MWVQGWEWQVGVPRLCHFLSSDPNDTGSITDGPRLNSSATVSWFYKTLFVRVYPRFRVESRLPCPVKLILGYGKKCVLFFFCEN